MPPITITEKDFMVLAFAAAEARDAGDMDQAKALDKLARMANAALTAASTGVQLSRIVGGVSRPVRWKEMPSTIES